MPDAPQDNSDALRCKCAGEKHELEPLGRCTMTAVGRSGLCQTCWSALDGYPAGTCDGEPGPATTAPAPDAPQDKLPSPPERQASGPDACTWDDKYLEEAERLDRQRFWGPMDRARARTLLPIFAKRVREMESLTASAYSILVRRDVEWGDEVEGLICTAASVAEKAEARLGKAERDAAVYELTHDHEGPCRCKFCCGGES